MWDDVTDISPRVKFAIQIVASGFMIWSAGVLLTSLDLLGWWPIGLWIFAVPLTKWCVCKGIGAATRSNL